ncbi:MAG: hypothetical protein Q9222_000490 [Ikaeria aurantiellina]
MVLQAIKYARGKLEILDQLRLPHEEIYLEIKSPGEAWTAIKSMQVRGAPAIAIVAALSVAVEAARWLHTESKIEESLQNVLAKSAASSIRVSLEYLVTSRPTAVNLADAAAKLESVVEEASLETTANARTVWEAYIETAERMLIDDVHDNERIGKYGAEWILKNQPKGAKVTVITHCNTGLHACDSLRHVYYTETRPYNQGSRLTGYELIHDNIPATLITDSMAAALMRTKKDSESIAAIIVGADRVALTGDTANKIGTYALAVLARHHGIQFLVAAPRTTIDKSTKSGADILIEERPEVEMLHAKGPVVRANELGKKEIKVSSVEEISIAARGTRAWNPAFDVTPAELIDGIVTEKGVVEKDEEGVFRWDGIFDADDVTVEEVPEVEQPKPLDLLPDGVTAVEPADANA